MTRVLRSALLIVVESIAFVAMFLAAPAVTDAQGWYLIAPPWRTAITADQDEFDTNAPLTKWEQMGAFDTARMCETSKLGIVQWLEKGDKQRLDQAAESYIRHPDAHPLETKEGEEYLRRHLAASRVRTSRCVSANDPRLR